MRWLAAVVLVAACEKAEPPPDPLHGVELPEVAGPGYVAAPTDPSILVSTHGFVIDGMAILSLTNGDVAPDEKEGGALGIKISRLTTMGGKLTAKHVPPPLVIAFDRRLTYQLLLETLFSLKQKEAGWKSFGMLAKVKAKTSMVMVPITLPDRQSRNVVRPGHGLQVGSGKPIAAPDEIPPIELVVSITRDSIMVWSISGLEGSLQVPKGAIARTDPHAMEHLSTTLAEIVHRRWPQQRPDDSRTIIVMADGNIPIQTMAETFGAVRAAADGSALFPDILLSSGFQ